MGAHPQPTNPPHGPRDVNARLARIGVVVTPSTPEGRRAVLDREQLRIPGVSLSETVVRMRDDDRTGA